MENPTNGTDNDFLFLVFGINFIEAENLSSEKVLKKIVAESML